MDVASEDLQALTGVDVPELQRKTERMVRINKSYPRRTTAGKGRQGKEQRTLQVAS
jgi:hypothetical protein